MKILLQFISDNAPSIARMVMNATAGWLVVDEAGLVRLIGLFVLFANGCWTVYENSKLVSVEQPKQDPPKSTNTPAALSVVLLLSCMLLGAGCSSILPGNDPVIVRAEQVEKTALAVFDTYVHVEFSQREKLKSISPEFVKVADLIRVSADDWIESLEAALKAYRNNRSPENKATLVTALAVLETSLAEAQRYLGQTQGIK